MLLIDLVIIGVTMEVIIKIIGAKIGAVAFFIIALISLVASVIYVQVRYSSEAQTSLWTGAWVSAILTILYVTIIKVWKTRKSDPQPLKSEHNYS
jgi:Na+/H+-translocating membrane pyrophosphatase